MLKFPSSFVTVPFDVSQISTDAYITGSLFFTLNTLPFTEPTPNEEREVHKRRIKNK